MFYFLYNLWLWFFDRFVIYPLMTIVAPKLGVTYMNLGYWPIEGKRDAKMVRFLESVDEFQDNENDKAHLYLYEKALSLYPMYPTLFNLDILEVSCGQGNSLNWIERVHGPISSIIGCDKIVNKSNKKIIYGNSMNLPFPDESFDYILNVEAAHLYSNCEKFFEECFRVLRPGGCFTYLDVRSPGEIPTIICQTSKCGFKLQHFEEITQNVVLGLDHTAEKYDKILARSPFFVKIFSNSLRATYCAPGTYTNDRLRNRTRVYLAGMWKKP